MNVIIGLRWLECLCLRFSYTPKKKNKIEIIESPSRRCQQFLKFLSFWRSEEMNIITLCRNFLKLSRSLVKRKEFWKIYFYWKQNIFSDMREHYCQFKRLFNHLLYCIFSCIFINHNSEYFIAKWMRKQDEKMALFLIILAVM